MGMKMGTGLLFWVLAAGLFGALLMFCGDMMLYFDREDFVSDGSSLEPIIAIMRKLPAKRVMQGGLIGPQAAFFYCLGFYHFVLITEEAWQNIAAIAFFLCCLGIIAGGAYHSHCAYLGLLGDEDSRKQLDTAISYFRNLSFLTYIREGLGLFLMVLLIAMGRTILSPWMAVLTPGVLFLLRPLARKLPKGLHIVLFGGFTNVIFIVYYIVMLIVCRNSY